MQKGVGSSRLSVGWSQALVSLVGGQLCVLGDAWLLTLSTSGLVTGRRGVSLSPKDGSSDAGTLGSLKQAELRRGHEARPSVLLRLGPGDKAQR